MIQKLEISGQHLEVSPKLASYVTKKIGTLDTYVSRKARASVHAEVKLKETKAKDKQQFTATVILYLPHEVLEASESTINIFAAVDIVETKLRAQLKKYKETHGDPKNYRHLLARLKRKGNVSEQ